MTNLIGEPRSRGTLTVDLGDLRRRVDLAAEREGMKPARWVRRAVGQALGDVDEAPDGRHARRDDLDAALFGGERGANIQLDPEAARRLDALMEKGGLRSRVAAVRALLDGVPMGAGQEDGLGAAVQSLGLSNFRLVDVARDVTRLRSELAAGAPAVDVDRLDRAVRDIRKHLEIASRLIGKLQPTLKSPGRRE